MNFVTYSRRTLLAAVLGSTALLLGACSGGGDESPPSSSAASVFVSSVRPEPTTQVDASRFLAQAASART